MKTVSGAWKRRLGLTSKVQGSGGRTSCFVRDGQGLGDAGEASQRKYRPWGYWGVAQGEFAPGTVQQEVGVAQISRTG